MKKVFIFIISLTLVLVLAACGSNVKNSDADKSANNKTSAQTKKEYSWPSDLEKFPVPKGTITNIQKYLDSKYLTPEDKTKPNLIIVEVTDMAKEDAQDYVQKLEAMGFAGGVNSNSSGKIMFSGNINSDIKKGVNFLYKIDSKTATISCNPQ